jgi:DNA-binding NarL/FixJ family response regulator
MSKPITVLLADDHALIREMLAERLEGESDIEVLASVADAGEALEAAKECPPVVLIMDIDMPGRSPFEVASEIRRVQPSTRVIFLSAHLNDQYIEQALESEAAGYLTKDEPTARLFEAIRAVARGGTHFSSAVSERIVIDEHGAHLGHDHLTRLHLLTQREREVLGHLAQGLPKKSIARLMGISVKTVEKHCDHVMEKLDIHDRVQLARFAIREGLSQP